MASLSAAARRAATMLAAVLLLGPAAAAQQRGAQPWPRVTIPPAPNAGLPSAPPAPRGVQPVPSALLPTSIQITRDAQGTGIVMYGALTGKAGSALSVLAGIFAYSQAFDPHPSLMLVVADRDDRAAQALFAATVQGSPVKGVAVVALDDNGGNVSVFYDYAGSFAGSFARLQPEMAHNGGGGTEALAQLRLLDGSEIGLPQGWRILSQGYHAVDLLGTRGEMLSLGAAIPVQAAEGAAPIACCDPVEALQRLYPQIAAAEQALGLPPRQLVGVIETQKAAAPKGGDAAFILASLVVGGRSYTSFGLVSAIAGLADPWTLYRSTAIAPAEDFARDFPLLLRVWKSYSANPDGFAAQLEKAVHSMDAPARMLEGTIAARQATDYSASDAWLPVIRASEGGGGPVSGHPRIEPELAETLAKRLTQNTGRNWRIVPLAEFE